ncbi:chorismate mutase [Pseudomonas sp. NPDC089396]|uniref:chorismate mutase n=1 Tax=Pseudomonas sp. NPDC089396 TaxID=3364461 RepID=UPI00383434AF
MRPFSLVALAALSLAGCTTTSTDSPAFAPLLDAIEQRLSLAEAVALHKWDQGQPVQATQREQQVLAHVRAAAPAYGLIPQRAEAFFADQIEANKLMQYTLLSRWHRQGVAPDTLRQDLQQQLRPQLDQLQATLLGQLAAFEQHPPRACAARLADALASRPVDNLTRNALIRATGQLCDKP